MFLLTLNKTSKATPLPVNKPDIKDPNEIILLKYNSVIITLEAQFGINPIKLDKIGPKILFLNIMLPKFSSPIKYITIFKMNELKTINKPTFNVCFIEDIIIP